MMKNDHNFRKKHGNDQKACNLKIFIKSELKCNQLADYICKTVVDETTILFNKDYNGLNSFFELISLFDVSLHAENLVQRDCSHCITMNYWANGLMQCFRFYCISKNCTFVKFFNIRIDFG